MVTVAKYHPGTTCQCIYEYLGSTHHAVCAMHAKGLRYGHKIGMVEVPLFYPAE